MSTSPDPGALQAAGPSSVRLVSGKLSDTELAAIAVAVSALSVVSREEAHERALAARAGGSDSGWTQPTHRLARGHELRGDRGPAAWRFSHR